MKLPQEFLDAVHNAPGLNLSSFMAIHESGEQVTSIRLNPLKPASLQFSTKDKVPWSTYGCYLAERPSFTLDPLFHAGAYYVQEASSMFIEQYLQQHAGNSPLKVLDLCAAPGGKSTLLQSLLPKGSMLVSNEVIRQRQNILAENITRWGAANVFVTGNEASAFAKLGEFFDIVLVDAPCSGSGLFRRDPQAITEWSQSQVLACAARQKNILHEVLPCLKEDGMLIYSTCSFSVEEDEDIAGTLQQDGLESLDLSIPGDWGIVRSTPGAGIHSFRFYPDKLKGEGFFIAGFRKRSNHPKGRPGGKRATLKKYPGDVGQDFLRSHEDFSVIELNDSLLAVPVNLLDDLLLLQQNMYIRKAGIMMGSMMKGSLVPSQELAMSVDYNHSFPECEIDLTNALDYLRRRDVNFGAAAKGWNLVTYKGLGLGWMKNVGNRVNNYYPREWRILNM